MTGTAWKVSSPHGEIRNFTTKEAAFDFAARKAVMETPGASCVMQMEGWAMFYVSVSWEGVTIKGDYTQDHWNGVKAAFEGLFAEAGA